MTEGELLEGAAGVVPERAASRERVIEHKQSLRTRLKRRVGRWMLKHLQKRLEREWREYEHAPKVTLASWSRRHREQGGTQVYRSLVQVHFHPRNDAPRQ